MKPPISPPETSLKSAFQLLGQVGLTMMACILTGAWAGIKLDAWWNTRGIAAAAGILLGTLGGAVTTGYLLYRSIPWKR